MTILGKKQMSEEDIKLNYITPVILNGWKGHITMETKITDGRINISGNIVARSKSKFADYMLYLNDGKPIAVVEAKNLVNGVIDYGNVKYITQEDADKINVRSMVDDDDILFAMIGSIGNPVLVKKDREFCIKNMALFKRFANTDISMRYVYWFLFYAQYKLKKEASGGVQSFISLSRFREYLIPLPPVAEQNRIVAKLEEILPLCERLK